MTYTSTCPPDHRHAEATTCYTTHKCRCAPCHQAWTDLNARRRKDIAYGRYVPRFVDAAPAREHVELLMMIGFTAASIADAAGLDVSTITNLLRPRGHGTRPITRRLHPDNANRILAVQRDATGFRSMAWVEGPGTQRRMQALIVRGWAMSALGRHCGYTPQRMQQIATAPRISVSVYRRVAALYAELENARPPLTTPGEKCSYTKALNMGRRRRWAPPAAWDDIDLDAQPNLGERDESIDEVAVALVIAGERGLNLNRAERHEVVKHFHAHYWSDGLIADLVGVDDRTILRDREELGLEAFDQTDILRRNAA